MKRFYHLALLTAAVLTLTVAAGSALAQVTPESGATYAGHVYLDLGTVNARFTTAPTSTQVAGDVYNNTASPANFGFSSTDLLAVFGDRVTTAGTGVLDQVDFTVYNSSTSAGALLTASYLISILDGATLAPLGSFTTATVTFGGGAGLAAGFYTVVSINGLGGLGIPIGTDVLITQMIAASTGAANKMGIVSMDPPTVGSSAPYMYISATTVGAPGFYNIGTSNANPGYRINAVAPTGTAKSTWGTLKNVYR